MMQTPEIPGIPGAPGSSGNIRGRRFHPLTLGVGAILVLALALAYAGGGPARLSAADPAMTPGPDAHPTTAHLAGFDVIDKRLGDKAPTGKGIVTGQVEAGPEDGYIPAINGDNFHGVTFKVRSGESKVSGHATAVATVIFGPKGLAPGITHVDLWSVNDWLKGGCIAIDRALEPDAAGVHLFNCSWISEKPTREPVLRRLDDMIDRQDVVVVVGVNNGHDKPVPALLASAYNVISVGEWTGNNSGGYTRFEGAGRCAPHIVAPGDRTSFAAPVVTAAAARLLEAAGGMPAAAGAAARKPIVIKAALLAGAEKPAGWFPAAGKPLDDHFGAGRVRFDRSYDIFMAGPHGPENPANASAWDRHDIGEKGQVRYALTLEKPSAVSIVLTWDRHVTGRIVVNLMNGSQVWDDDPRVADLDLALAVEDHDAPDGWREVARSDSKIDNIEHVYQHELPAGKYRMTVSRKDARVETWDYALAWHVGGPEAALTPPPPKPAATQAAPATQAK